MTNSFTLEQAQALESSYQPNQKVADVLKDKSLVMFIGPVAIGKTYIMNTVASTHPAFSRVPTFTTREPRDDDDPYMFRYIPQSSETFKNLLENIQARNVVQYVVHPTTFQFYGSEIQDYPNEYNMLATLSGVAERLSRLPFKHTVTIGLACKPDTWEEWLTKRYPEPNNEKQRRIQEAITCLEWLVSHDGIVIENVPNQPEKTARDVIDAILYNKRNDEAKTLAYAMLKRAKELL